MAKKITILRCEPLESRRLMAADLAIEVDQVAGLRAAEIRLSYDASSLELSSDNIRLGDLWQDKASLLANVDEAEGTINLFVFSVEPLPAASGPLVEMQFDVVHELASDVAMATISRLRLNEGAIDTEARLVSDDAPSKYADRQRPVKTMLDKLPAAEDVNPVGRLLGEADSVTHQLEVASACQVWRVDATSEPVISATPQARPLQPSEVGVKAALLYQAAPLIVSKNPIAD